MPWKHKYLGSYPGRSLPVWKKRIYQESCRRRKNGETRKALTPWLAMKQCHVRMHDEIWKHGCWEDPDWMNGKCWKGTIPRPVWGQTIPLPKPPPAEVSKLRRTSRMVLESDEKYMEAFRNKVLIQEQIRSQRKRKRGAERRISNNRRDLKMLEAHYARTKKRLLANIKDDEGYLKETLAEMKRLRERWKCIAAVINGRAKALKARVIRQHIKELQEEIRVVPPEMFDINKK